MKRIVPLTLVLVLGLCVAFLSWMGRNKKAGESQTPTVLVEPRPWSHEGSDLQCDPRLRLGHLGNGFRYVLRTQTEPPGRVSMRLHVAAGSLMEQEDQRGLAHFLEHMLFNGTRNFKAGELVPMMQRMGIGFGAHANAYTSFNETVYMLDLPNREAATMDLGMTVMRDFADGALLLESEIHAEREVILAEKTSRDSVDFRMMQRQFEALLPEFLATHRFPIGLENVISGAPRERFVDFYERHYRPESMTFFLVGDMGLNEMESIVRERFESLAPGGVAQKQPDMGEVKHEEAMQAFVFDEPELSEEGLSLTKMAAKRPEKDSRASRMDELPLALAHRMLGRRFDLIKKTENSPISAGGGWKRSFFGELEVGNIEVTIAQGDWEGALDVLNAEFRRTLDHGFTNSELQEAVAKLLQEYRRAAETEERTPSPQLANNLIRKMGEGKVFTTPELDLAIATDACNSITPETCQEAFRAYWSTPGTCLLATWRDAKGITEDELLERWEHSGKQELVPREEHQASPFAYEDFGSPGDVSRESEDPELELRQLVLNNRVRVNMKRTEFAKDTILLLARFGTGMQSMPGSHPGLQRLTQTTMTKGGLGKHSADELEQLLAGKTVTVSFKVGEDAFELRGETNQDDLPFQLQLMAAYLSDPGYRPESFEHYRKDLPKYYQLLEHELDGAFEKLRVMLAGEDPRFRIPEREQAEAYTLEDVQGWLDAQRNGSYLELSIVGDFEPDNLLQHILATFGALPARADARPAGTSQATLPPFVPINDTNIEISTKVERAAAVAIWPAIGFGGGTVGKVRRYNLLTSIFDDRLRVKVREELGDSYSPSVSLNSSELDETHGTLLAIAITQPEKAKKLADFMKTVGFELAENGVSSEELERAKAPLLSQIERQKRQNSYWIERVLAKSQQDPRMLDWARNLQEDYASIAKEELDELARKCLTAETCSRVYLIPTQEQQPEASSH